MHEFIKKACGHISDGDMEAAKSEIINGFPMQDVAEVKRGYTEKDKTRVFVRDGFIDRYTGNKLIFPPVLRILSMLIPEEFPYQQNWKYGKCTEAYWYLTPTIDHIVPVARGGADTEANWVTTTQKMNSAKAHWTLEELGWTLLPAGTIDDWDGMTGWFLDYVERNPEVLTTHSYMRIWYNALKHVLHH
jgi:5-methylcytosine-specific restriction endonuclease McrA